jgi:RNA polymerase sigma-70 factor (ECF subfamily)
MIPPFIDGRHPLVEAGLRAEATAVRSPSPTGSPNVPTGSRRGIIGRTGDPSIRRRGSREPACVVIATIVRPAPESPPGIVVGLEVSVAVRDMDDARDRELLRRVREGDPAGEAFRALFRRNGSVAKAVALRVTRSDELAEEAVQEAFLQLWRTPDRYDASRSTVRRWVLTLVHARAVDLVRREQAHRRRAEQATRERLVVPDPSEDVVQQVARPAERASVQAALDVLPPEQRDVIDLMYFHGLSQTGVAERLGIPLGTVKSRTVLAMRKLRGVMAEAER